MKIVNDHYPETGDSDSDLGAIVNDLDRIGQLCRSSTVPRQHDARVVQALRERAAERAWHDVPRPLRRRLVAQHRSLAVVAVVAVSLIAIAGGAYAAVSTLSRVFDMGVAKNVLTQNLGAHINQSQTVAGYTMTVERAYADSNRVLIAYTISPPATAEHQWNLTPDSLTVATDAGVELPDRGYVVATESGQPDATLQMFDAAGITGNPDVLHLRLTVPWIDGVEQLQALPTTVSSPPGGDHGLPTSGPYGSIATDPASRPNGVQDPYTHDFRVFGPLTFNVTVPFVAGREVNLHQQVQAGGLTATLERVVISPTETRVYVSGIDAGTSPYVHATLSGDGWTDEKVDGGSTSVWRSNGMTVFSYLGSFMDRHGAWTLAVQSNPGSPPVGPWTFHFTAP